MKFDEKGRYIPLSEQLPKQTKTEKMVRKFNKKAKDLAKNGGVQYYISGPFWTKPSPKWQKLLEESLKPRYSGEKAYPQHIHEAAMKKLEENGFIQICYGREFIERSYALAKKAEDLQDKKVHNYDNATGEYFFDKDLQLYWRYTGFFD